LVSTQYANPEGFVRFFNRTIRVFPDIFTMVLEVIQDLLEINPTISCICKIPSSQQLLMLSI
jgi:hypothetical protein